MKRKIRRPSRGNALMEYVVPASVILLTAGVLATATDITGLIGEYFMAATGHTSANLAGSTFRTRAIASNVKGLTGSGVGGFTSQQFARLVDGNGQAIGTPKNGTVFSMPITRAGGRLPSTNTEYLYP